MAERKAVNKYYPPDWDPKKGSINKYVGQHPLRDRARKLSQGILIIRFEMPFNIWCLGCQSHIGMGVRYNAEKKKIGNYFSTPIYSFRMKCHLCSNWMEIHTDPKTAQYLVISGAARKNEQWDASTSGTIQFKSEKEAEKLALNPFFKLEHDVADREKGESSKLALEKLKIAQDKIFKNDYESSRLARSILRDEKKLHKAKVDQADSIRNRLCVSLPLLPEIDDDVKKAKSVFVKDQRKHQDKPINAVKLSKILKKKKVIHD